MAKVRRILNPVSYLRKRNPDGRVTGKRIGRLHADMQRRGKATACPPTAPAQLERVWVDSKRPEADVVQAALAGREVDREELARLAGARSAAEIRFRRLATLGVAVVPAADGRLRLVGTSPHLAAIVNQAYFGHKRRRLDAREVVEAVFGLASNGRRTSVTEGRLEYALAYFQNEFGLDLTGVIGREYMLIPTVQIRKRVQPC